MKGRKKGSPGKKTLERVGQRFGMAVLLRFVEPPIYHAKVECRCDCGVIFTTRLSNLVVGCTKSCGCFQARNRRDSNLTHGHAPVGKPSRTYKVWSQMKTRCYNPNNNRWHLYGARGIKLCPRWVDSFENFLADMGERPSPKHTIDRLDRDKDYSPQNCRWATYYEQNRNKPNIVWYEFGGMRETQITWARLLQVPEDFIIKRRRKGVPFNEIFYAARRLREDKPRAS